MLRVVFEESSVVIEGGISGRQQRLVCPNCGKIFFAWRPDELPGVKVKCYFCKHEFADEVALRAPAPAPAPAVSDAGTPPADAAAADTPAVPAPVPSATPEPTN